jgi:hypothetical protein
MIEVFDCEQGTDPWYACRLGIPTASRFKDVLAKGEGKTRKRYLLDLAGERLTGECAETFSNVHMERGKTDGGRGARAVRLHDGQRVRPGGVHQERRQRLLS